MLGKVGAPAGLGQQASGNGLLPHGQVATQGQHHELAAHLHTVAVVAVPEIAHDGWWYAEEAAHFLYTELAGGDPLGILQGHGDSLVVHPFLKDRGLTSVGPTPILRLPALTDALTLVSVELGWELEQARQAGAIAEGAVAVVTFSQGQLYNLASGSNRRNPQGAVIGAVA